MRQCRLDFPSRRVESVSAPSGEEFDMPSVARVKRHNVHLHRANVAMVVVVVLCLRRGVSTYTLAPRHGNQLHRVTGLTG